MATRSDPELLTAIEALEARLSRLEYLLTQDGSFGIDRAGSSLNTEDDHKALARLKTLEQRFSDLVMGSSLYSDILQLNSRHPELFEPSEVADGPDLATEEKLAIINANAPSYPTASSRLTSIEDLPIPVAKSSVSLISLSPRLWRARYRQTAHAKELMALRLRSAALLQRWYEVGVIGSSECWSDWESRLLDVEISVRREEVQAEQDAIAAKVYHTLG